MAGISTSHRVCMSWGGRDIAAKSTQSDVQSWQVQGVSMLLPTRRALVLIDNQLHPQM